MTGRIGFVGTRPAEQNAQLREYNELCSAANRELGKLGRGCVVVSGGAYGIDTYCVNVAQQKGFSTKVWPADWKKLGKRAGFVRNQQIVDDSDYLLAFPSSWSVGTWHTIELAAKAGKSCRVFMYDQELDEVRELTQQEVVAKKISSAR